MSAPQNEVGHGQPIADEGTLTLAVPKASAILEKAADLIEPEGRWIQGDAARNAQGRPTSANGPNASCWCAMGALLASGSWSAREWLLTAIGDCEDSVSNWNDAPERTQAEVVAKLREAASLAREAGQ